MKSSKDAGWILILLLIAAFFMFLSFKGKIPLK